MTDDRRALARVPWRALSTRPIYVNPWLRVREDVAAMPDGRHTLYGVVTTGTGLAVGMLPFLDADTVVLVGQYRYITRRFSWEIPTGAVAPGESLLDAAQRELAEEAGYRAARLEPLGVFETSKSVLEETAHVYIATGLTPVTHETDATEFIEVGLFAFEEVVRMIDRGEIFEAMTIVAVLQAARRRR